MTEPRAKVIEVDGQLVLDDPDALGVIKAVERANLDGLVGQNLDRINHFRERARVLQKTSADTVIVLLAVDDPAGGALAEALMPGHNWQEYRDRGEVPIARGLVWRDGIEDALIDDHAAAALRGWTRECLAVVVVDRGVAGVF